MNQNFNDIDLYPYYDGEDLGVVLSEEKTSFRLWAPTAQAVTLRVYDKEKKCLNRIDMQKSDLGTWYYSFDKNLNGFFYTYQTYVNDVWLNEVVDPYATGVSVNGTFGAIVDLSILPENVKVKGASDDTVIYEASIRDISIDSSSGISRKGKFKGLTEKGTTSGQGLSTGLDHLIELGITHLHLMPCYDFKSIDEEKFSSDLYNWGYDPQNYNAPEGSYSTDAFDPITRNIEFKQMVNALHESGIKVIMDVVYSHTFDTKLSAFNQLVPGYFYRFWSDGSFSNGSGCDNEIATERPMVRKFVIDSICHWIKKYDIDGFRFDLMALYDLNTIHEIAHKVREIKSDILMYGEGWTGGDSPLPMGHRASKHNTINSEVFSSFNDDFRDALKGKLFDSKQKGFISGEGWMEETIKFGIVGAIYHPQIDYNLVLHSDSPWTRQPNQSINYISCHDNHTLFDKLELSNPSSSPEEVIAMHTLGLAMVLTSQGIPFLHSGTEFLRTKNGYHNSYNLPDSINKIDWERKSDFRAVNDFVSGLIHLRRKQSIFRIHDASILQRNLSFFPFQTGNLIVYRLVHPFPKDKEWKEMIVAHNGSTKEVNIEIPEGNWSVGIEKNQVNEVGIRVITEGALMVTRFSTSILFKA